MATHKLIAKTVINRALEPGKPGNPEKGIRATPPKIEEIPVGELFEASAEEREELIRMGAALDAPKDADKDSMKRSTEKRGPGRPKKAADTTPKAADAGEAGKGDDNKDVV